MKRLFLITGFSLIIGLSHGQRGVVLILADDMGAHLSCLGTKGIKTPAVDKLAGEGVLFTEAFSSCASCSPSRSSILTGMYPHSNVHWRNTRKRGHALSATPSNCRPIWQVNLVWISHYRQ